MPGSVKTDAIVLRTIRYGEADRILHLYAPEHGQIAYTVPGMAAFVGRHRDDLSR